MFGFDIYFIYSNNYARSQKVAKDNQVTEL